MNAAYGTKSGMKSAYNVVNRCEDTVKGWWRSRYESTNTERSRLYFTISFMKSTEKDCWKAAVNILPWHCFSL